MRKLILPFLLGLACLTSGEDPNPAVRQDENPKKSFGDLRFTVFKKYDKKNLPTRNRLKTLSVSVSIQPTCIKNVDEEKQNLDLDVILTMRWKDDHLKWNEDSHHGVNKLVVPTDDIWTPDIPDITGPSNVILFSSGEVLWSSTETLTSLCPTNDNDTSYDTQTCEIELRSEAYDSSMVAFEADLSEDPLEAFVDNNIEWGLQSLAAGTETVNLTCCPDEQFSTIHCEIVMKRKEVNEIAIIRRIAYYAVILGLLMFWLPPDAVHKIILGALAEMLLVLCTLFLAQNLKSPTTKLHETERLRPLMCFVAGMLCAEVLVINMGRMLVHCRPSRCLLGIAKCCCQPFCVCFSGPYRERSRSPSQHGDKSKKSIHSPRDEWGVVAMALDRILFLGALLGALYYYKYL